MSYIATQRSRREQMLWHFVDRLTVLKTATLPQGESRDFEIDDELHRIAHARGCTEQQANEFLASIGR
jgi:hypothetical protein